MYNINMFKLEELSKAPEVIEHINTIDINDFYSYAFHGDKMIVISRSGAYFIDISSPDRPNLLGFTGLRKESIGQYSNGFIGFHDRYALFSIGYDGIEVVDISDLKKPTSYCFIPRENSEIGSFDAIINDLGINRWGIYDISDINNFRPLLKFGDALDWPKIFGDYIYYFHKDMVKIVALNSPTEIHDVYRFNNEVHNVININGDLFIAQSKNTIFVFRLKHANPFVEIVSVLSYNTKVNRISKIEGGFIVSLPPLFREHLELISLANPIKPDKLFTIEAWPVLGISSGNNFFTCQNLKGKKSMEEMGKSVISVLKVGSSGTPELIAEFDDPQYSGCYCLGDLIYHRGEGVLNIYKVGLPQS